MSDTQVSVPPNALGRIERYQPLLLLASIGAGMVLAHSAPSLARSLGPAVSLGVAVLMFLVMVGLDLRRVAGALSQRRFLAIAVTLNFVVNPALAWAMGEVFLGNQPALRIGLVLFLVTPCIGWYLVFTELAGGDTGLGVSLLGLNLVLQVLLLPLYLAVLAGKSAGIEITDMAGSIAVFIGGPAAAAAATRRLSSRSDSRFAGLHHTLAHAELKTVTVMVVVASMFASRADVIFDNVRSVTTLLVPLGAFFLIAFTTALMAGRAARLPHAQTALLVFTTTSRNSEASLAIAATAFADPLVALTVVVGPVVELPLLVVMVRVLRALQPDSSRTILTQPRKAPADDPTARAH